MRKEARGDFSWKDKRNIWKAIFSFEGKHVRHSIVRDNRDRGGRSNSRVNASKAIVLEPFVRLTGSRVGFTSRTSPKTDSASTNT